MFKSSKSMVISGFLSLMSLFVVLTTLTCLDSKAASPQAQNPYEMGKDFYKKGDYVKARHYLEYVAFNRPNYWPAHYALGNTFMKMGELQLAKSSYMSCLLNKPDIPTCKNCSKAIEYLNIAIAQKEKANPSKDETKITEEAVDKNSLVANEPPSLTPQELAYEAKVKELTEKRDKILADGHKQAQAIRDRYEAKFREIHETTNQWVINRETGEIHTGLDVDTHESLCAERDYEIKKVIEIAEARARGIHIPAPPPPSGHGLASSNLHPHSNAYVQHYKHKSSHNKNIAQSVPAQNRKMASSNASTTSK